MTLWKCIDDYLTGCYGLRPGTQALYKTHLLRLLRFAGDVKIEMVTPGVVRQFMAGLRRKDGHEYSRAYVDQVYRTLHTFGVWLVDEGVVTVNPLDRVARPRVPKRKSPRLALDEIRSVFRAIEASPEASRNRAMLCLMIGSGLRRGEVLGLECDHVDLDRGVVRVNGKGQIERDVPIDQITAGAIAVYLRERPETGDRRLFVTAAGTPLTEAGLCSMMKRLARRAGLRRLYPHLLRHTFANVFISRGGGLRKLQAILGHASIETTASIYTDPELSELQDEQGRCSPLGLLTNTDY